MTNDEVLQRIRGAPNLLAVSRGAGVPYTTLHSIKVGKTTDPRTSSIDKVRDYFERGGGVPHIDLRLEGEGGAQ